MEMNVEGNEILDAIIAQRWSIRVFKEDIPQRELIAEVIRAGIYAPFGALAVSGEDYRRFYVIEKGSVPLSNITEITKRRATGLLEKMNSEMASAFYKKMQCVSKQGPIGIGTAPYFIVVAERKGIPSAEEKSLAHCMQNMWL